MGWHRSIFYLGCIYYCIIVIQPYDCILSWCLSINSRINCISCSWKYFRSPSYKCISSWNCLIIWSTCMCWHLFMIYRYWIYNFFSISIIIYPCNCMWSIYTFIFIIISCIIIFTWNEHTYWSCPWCSIPYCISCSCISSMYIFIYWICTIHYLSRNTCVSTFCIWVVTIFTWNECTYWCYPFWTIPCIISCCSVSSMYIISLRHCTCSCFFIYTDSSI